MGGRGGGGCFVFVNMIHTCVKMDSNIVKLFMN